MSNNPEESQEEPKKDPKEESQEDSQEDPKKDPKEESQEDSQEDPKEESQEDSQEDSQEESQEEPKEESEEETKKEKKKYVHNCTKCGSCCEKWQEIPIYIEDMQRWLIDGSIQYILPFLQVRVSPPAYVRLVLQKNPVEGEDPNPSGCPLYDPENKICNLYSSMPLHCASYPLAFNGEAFYLIDTESPGLSNGTMTAESLESARNVARENFSALSSSSALLPVLYNIILMNIMQQSQEAMNALSDEDKEQLEKLLSKPNEETEETVEDDDTPKLDDE